MVATLKRASTWVLVALMTTVTSSGADAQARPEITVGVRPEHVRVGEAFTVTVRVVAPVLPDAVDLEPGPAAEMVSFEDRTSTRLGAAGVRQFVFERDFSLVARVPGSLALRGVLVDIGGEIVEAAIPMVTAAPAGLQWGTPGGSPRSSRAREPRVLPEGVPPTSDGRTYDRTQPQAYPYGYPTTALDPRWGTLGVPPLGPGLDSGVPYGPGVGQYGSSPTVPGGYPGVPGGYPGAPGGYGGGIGGYGVYGGYGRLPPGEGWAATATADPWWPEMLPELNYYESIVEDPNGLAVLQSGLTPTQVYVGQQVTLVATATFPPEARYRMARDPEFFPPAAVDAWVVDVPYVPAAPAAIGGRLEQAHTFMRAFFPLGPGRFTVGPARLGYSAAGGAGRPLLDTLSSGSLTAEVLPIPESDAPPTWNGAVGRYRIAAWITPAEVGWGESALLMVEIAGAGHLPSQPRPDPGPVWGGGLRPMGERAWVEVRDGVVGGVKRFTWLVVPVESGEVRIGPIFYSFFDPYVGAFGQVISEELQLLVHAYPGDPRTSAAQPGAPAELRYPSDPLLTDPFAYPDPLPSRGAAGYRGVTGYPGATPSPGASAYPDGNSYSDANAAPARMERPERAAQVHATRLQEYPQDAEAWLELGRAYEQARPGEGWAEWRGFPGFVTRRAMPDCRKPSGVSPPGVLRSVCLFYPS